MSSLLSRIRKYFVHLSIPIGMSYPYGKLYGWTIHEARHNPEPETVEFFKKHIKPGDVIADIGGNIGYYTLQFSHLVGKAGKVVTFEPSPSAFRSLKKATKNTYNITLVNKGVFSSSTTLTLYSPRPGHGMASVMYQAGEITNLIELIPLKNYPADFTWAKIDVEGAELEVLRGMRKPIKCVLEVARGIIAEQGNGIKHFFNEIEKMGYHIYFIIANGETVAWNGKNLSSLVNNIYIEPNR